MDLWKRSDVAKHRILAQIEGAYAAATVTIMGNRDKFQWQEPEKYNAVDELVAEMATHEDRSIRCGGGC